MKSLKVVGIVVAIAGLAALALVLVPSAYGQGPARGDQMARGGGQDRPDRALMMLAGRGAEIGVRIADGVTGGVVIEEVVPDSPAEKAGLKPSDVIVEFDGARVRSARQFGRLVEETPPGRTVKATVTRDGQKQDVQVTPSEGRGARTLLDGGRLRGDLERLGDHLPPFNFNFDFDLPGVLSGRRLGVTVDELTDQLATYFGAKQGLLVTAVTDGGAASRAGLKAGDVITSIDGQSVQSRADMVRALRDAKEDEVTIGIVREKKESSVKAKLEAPTRRNFRRGRPA